MGDDDDTTRPAEATSKKPMSRIGPNGLILGPDGKPCKVRLPDSSSKSSLIYNHYLQACNNLKAFGAVAGSKSSNKGKEPMSLAGIGVGTAASVATTPKHVNGYENCPADVELLGRHTWTFLHSTAAYYPELPTEGHKENARRLFDALPSLYPCRHCADELSKEMQKVGPADVSGRSALSNWLCVIHNEVNTRLGKKEFDCGKVLQRWKEGWEDGHCD